MLETRPRTPFDLLEDGASPDLRDARVLAWLLDPEGEHGLGRAMLVALGACMAEKGKKALSRLLASPAPPPFETSVRLRDGRVELVVSAMGHDMIGVWRTHARGYAGALEVYASDDVPVIGIARTLEAFPPETAAAFPMLTWAEVVRVLDAPGAEDAPLQAVAVAFRERLRARLGEARAGAPAAVEARGFVAPAFEAPPPAPLPAPLPAAAAEPPRPIPAPPPSVGPSATRRLTRPTMRPAFDARGAAERLLEAAPDARRWIPGLAPAPRSAALPPPGSLLLSADRRRRYLLDRTVGSGREGQVVQVAVHGGDPFPGFEEELAAAVMKIAHEGSDVLARERAVYARAHPGLVRMLLSDPGPPPFLLLEPLVAHPLARFGRVDPVTAVNGFVNLLEALHGIHEAVGVVLCSIDPGNIMLRIPGDAHGHREYVARLAAGAWEPVFMDVGGALGDADLEGGTPPLLTGDPLYLPPEAMPRGGAPGRYSRKTDVYGLTLTFYEHLTGERAYGRAELHARKGVEYLAELLQLKDKGTSPVNGLLLHERFEADVAEDLLAVLRAGLATDPAQRLQAEALLELCRKRLKLVERRPAIPPARYVYDADVGLHLEQRLLPKADLRAVYGGSQVPA